MRLSKVISSVCVVLVLQCAASAADDWEAFKARMMPQIGKTVTVSGELFEGKDSPFVLMPGGGRVNLKFDFDDNLMERKVTATGTLRYRPYQAAPAPGISAIGEMFFLEKGKAALRVPVTR